MRSPPGGCGATEGGLASNSERLWAARRSQAWAGRSMAGPSPEAASSRPLESCTEARRASVFCRSMACSISCSCGCEADAGSREPSHSSTPMASASRDSRLRLMAASVPSTKRTRRSDASSCAVVRMPLSSQTTAAARATVSSTSIRPRVWRTPGGLSAAAGRAEGPAIACDQSVWWDSSLISRLPAWHATWAGCGEAAGRDAGPGFSRPPLSAARLQLRGHAWHCPGLAGSGGGHGRSALAHQKVPAYRPPSGRMFWPVM